MSVDDGETACRLMKTIVGDWSNYQFGKLLYQEELPHQTRGR